MLQFTPSQLFIILSIGLRLGHVKSLLGWYNKAVPKKKRKQSMKDAQDAVLGFANLVDALFLRYTGKTLGAWIQEPRVQPKELPKAEQVSIEETDMPLVDAYAVMGLKPEGASIEEVKKRYQNLANLFHPDHGGYNEAMVLLNRAYQRILKERGQN